MNETFFTFMKINILKIRLCCRQGIVQIRHKLNKCGQGQGLWRELLNLAW